jgi:flagellar biosynthesis/type III secretory pathway protein FliH
MITQKTKNVVREKNQNNSDFELLIAQISERQRITIQQLEEAYIIGWEDGIRAGASEAFDKGYAQGVDEGFKDGYQEAKASSALYAEE